MKGKRLLLLATTLTTGLGGLAATAPAGAAMFDFMNPSRWFDNDRYDRYDRYGRYGGWGSPYGWGGGGPYGYGYGPYGYGGGPWGSGWGGYPGYGPGSTIVVTPQSGSSDRPAPPRLPE